MSLKAMGEMQARIKLERAFDSVIPAQDIECSHTREVTSFSSQHLP